MPFPPLVVHYRDPARPPDLLWLALRGHTPAGRAVYLAAGPAGKRVGAHLIRHVSTRGLPDSVSVAVCTQLGPDGQLVYGTPAHTMN